MKKINALLEKHLATLNPVERARRHQSVLNYINRLPPLPKKKSRKSP